MSTKNVVLTKHHEKFISSLVNGGQYQNASEVMRDGLRVLEERHQEHLLKLELLRKQVKLGLEESRDGFVTIFVDEDKLNTHFQKLTREVISKSKKKSKQKQAA
jgi:antitoxin ParD1/3/4